MINFKASYHLSTEYLKKNVNNEYEKFPASFVEIQTKQKDDIFALMHTAKLWQTENNGKTTFASDIAHDAYYDNHIQTAKIFALTKQKNNFENLIPEKILALMEVLPRGKKLQEIIFLQVSPEKNFNNKNREYKNIGKSFVTSLINLFPQKDIVLEPLENARKFYLKLGFENQLLSRTVRYYA